ncbi:MAG: carboxylesterase family protein [Proteobacteria bacterium]|nr:carboxylesterase family protein [Pseudomonadota bacterium]
MLWEMMRKKSSNDLFRIILILIGALLIAGCNISGKVTLDGEGVQGVSVALSGNGVQKTVTTNKNGYYEFRNIAKGLYKVSVLPPEGYTGNPAQRVEKSSKYADVYAVHFKMESDTIKEISSGTIIGKREENGIAAWYGIPFAKPPVDDLRWKAPQPEESWDDAYMAATPCEPCTQYVSMLTGLSPEYYNQVIGSEDCLYLNVWAPENASGEPKPVMLWVHGGANSIGEGAIYNGKMLAEKHDVIVVAINYRLGPFGWFAHPALRGEGTTIEDQSGNFGTLDIIRGLEWVQQNIDAFGGDKNNVTLFGESAGAINTLTLLASPLTEGLFHSAIAESPVIEWIAEHTNWQPMSVAENYMDDDEPGHHASSRETINNLLMEDGLAIDRDAAKALQDSMGNEDIEAYLRTMPAEKIMSVLESKYRGMIIMPSAIQDGYVIPKKGPLDVFQSGEYHQMPIMIGTNREEMKLFLMLDPYYTMNIMEVIPIILKPVDYELAAQYCSEAWKVTSVDELATAMSIHQPNDIYAYRFDWDDEANMLGIDLGAIVGAAHGVEIPSVFADPDMVIMESMSLTYTPENKPGRVALAESMSSYWAAMAYTGSPGTGMPYAPQAVEWTPWTNDAGAANLMIFDSPSDAGINMVNFHLYSDDVQERLQNETGFTTDTDQCMVYKAIYGEDEFYQAHCSGL